MKNSVDSAEREHSRRGDSGGVNNREGGDSKDGG